MLKIVFRKCASIDVHSTQITVCIAITDENDITSYETRTFPTFTQNLRECRDWLISKDIYDVCMEYTGKYWIPVYNILEDKIRCIITHPKYVRTILGKKTDKKDAKWIADMFKHGLVEPSFMPPKDIRELRDLMRYRNKLVNIRTGEKNRFQNSLAVSNIQIANVLTDTFGKTAQSILTSVLENPNISLNDIKPLLVQCALCAIKDNSTNYFKLRYESIKRRRGHKVAIIAIAKLLLTCVYNILKTGEVFDVERCNKLIERNFKSHKKTYSKTEEMISYLSSLGYNITLSDN
ncbi:MAG: transposase [bacterium]|nr:transposase [bacterium]